MPEYKLDILKAAYDHSIHNQEEIRKSDMCGCFFCKKTFKPVAIAEWTDIETTKGETALCPHCAHDSVIGSDSGFPVSDEDFLTAMSEHWF